MRLSQSSFSFPLIFPASCNPHRYWAWLVDLIAIPSLIPSRKKRLVFMLVPRQCHQNAPIINYRRLSDRAVFSACQETQGVNLIVTVFTPILILSAQSCGTSIAMIYERFYGQHTHSLQRQNCCVVITHYTPYFLFAITQVSRYLSDVVTNHAAVPDISSAAYLQ